jgi:hypothetical protein
MEQGAGSRQQDALLAGRDALWTSLFMLLLAELRFPYAGGKILL